MNKSSTASKLALYLSWGIGLILVLLPFHAFLTVWFSSSIGHYTFLRLWKEFLLVILVTGSLVLLLRDRGLSNSFISSRLIRLILIYIGIDIVWGLASYIQDKVTSKALGYGLIVNLRFLVFFLCVWVVATN